MRRSSPALPGQGRRVDVGPGRLERGAQDPRHVRRAGVAGQRLDRGRRVHPLDLSSGQRPVLGDLDELSLLQLREVVVEAVRRQAHAGGQFLGRLGPQHEKLEQADAQRVRERAVHRLQPWFRTLVHWNKILALIGYLSNQWTYFE